MSGHASSPTELAANQLLKLIASRDGDLHRVLNGLNLLSESPRASARGLAFPAPPRLTAAEAASLLTSLKAEVSPAVLRTVELRTGVESDRFLTAAVEQLRLVAMFATSDGGAVSDNVRAVEKLVRGGGAEMFAAA
jgi:hypothetical protein